MHFFKKILIIGILAAIFYALLGYHYIFIGKVPKMLKKSELTMKYTFFSTTSKTTDAILSVPELWNDGIGDLLLREGIITEDELEMYRLKMEGEED